MKSYIHLMCGKDLCVRDGSIARSAIRYLSGRKWTIASSSLRYLDNDVRCIIMTSLGSWLKDWIPYWPNPYTNPTLLRERMDGTRVAEALISELLTQMRLAEEREKEEEQERKRLTSGGVDYSWLVSSPLKSYTLPEIERLELESLCTRVTPEESSRVMRSFRAAIQREPSPGELPSILRAVIRQIIDSRPEERASSANGSTPAWLSKSMASLRSLRRVRSNAVSASFEDCVADVEMQRCDSVGCNSADLFQV